MTDTAAVITFDLVNNWYGGDITWNLSDPLIENVTSLDHNQTMLVLIEHNYSQGEKEARVDAFADTFVDSVLDYFWINPLMIESMSTLSDGLTAVTEILVENNLAVNQSFSWRFDTGVENITSTSLTNVEESAIILIESNQVSEGVYKTTGVINSSSYDDNERGVIVG